MSTAELRRQVKERIERLSPGRLQVALDFLAYLEERESSEATDELLRIPGFLQSLDKAEREVSKGASTPAHKLSRKA